MEESKLKCPSCGAAITLEHLKAMPRETLLSIRGLAGLALRKAPPKPGPGRGHKGKMKPAREGKGHD